MKEEEKKQSKDQKRYEAEDRSRRARERAGGEGSD